MLQLAGREGDGAIINWLSADDVRTVAPIVGPTRRSSPASSCCRARTRTRCAPGRRMIAEYLNVPVYAAFHDWIGRGDRSDRCGTRGKPVTAPGHRVVPDEVLDDLIVWGSPERMRGGVGRLRRQRRHHPRHRVLAERRSRARTKRLPSHWHLDLEPRSRNRSRSGGVAEHLQLIGEPTPAPQERA